MLVDGHLSGNHLLVQLNGDILMDNSRDCYVELDKMIFQENQAIRLVSFDFLNVRYLDSSGIGAILKITDRMRDSGIQILVFNLNKTLHSVFRLSGLGEHLLSIDGNDFVKKYPEFASVVTVYGDGDGI